MCLILLFFLSFYCRHRNPLDHDCPFSEQALKDIKKREISKFLKDTISLKESSSSSKSMTPSIKKLKVNPQLEMMKMKMKAIGSASIPNESRIYVKVFFPVKSSSKDSVFFESYFFDKVKGDIRYKFHFLTLPSEGLEFFIQESNHSPIFPFHFVSLGR